MMSSCVNLDERLTYLRNLEERKETVLASIEEQGKLTEELKQQILAAQTQVLWKICTVRIVRNDAHVLRLQKKKGWRTGKSVLLQMLDHSVEEEAKQYLDEEKEVATVEQAISGALDILAEAIADEADYRTAIRKTTMQKGSLVSTAKNAEEKTVYENYYDFSTVLSKVSGYQTLAINRGEKEKILTVKIEAPEDDILRYLRKKVIVKENEYTTSYLEEMIADSYKRLIAPAIEREIRNELTETAEDGAIRVFGKNLEQLLMQPPIAGKVVLGWDPAFRTGCKLAVVDETERCLIPLWYFQRSHRIKWQRPNVL